MTNEQAIRILRNMAFLSGNEDAEKTEKAINMAIESLSCSEKPNNSDLISRQDAIAAIRNIKAKYCETADDLVLLVDKAAIMTELMLLPSAQPERKKGEWIKKNDSAIWYCSECDLPSMHKWPYCEQCGADMRGEG